MKTRLMQPGEPPRALNWTNRHPNQASRAGLMLYRHSSIVLSGPEFRAMRDGGAWIESTHPERVRRALGLEEAESGVLPLME